MQNIKNKTMAKKNESEKEKALRVIEESNKKDIEECQKELDNAIKPILEKYGCSLVMSGRFEGNQIEAGMIIVKIKK